jgi:outer membrane protein assembly factor BamE
MILLFKLFLPPHMRKPLFFAPLLASVTLISCTTILNNLPGVYTLDIQQGNIVDQAMIDQLRPNMTKRQVLYIMGSPMLTDPFHEKRWDYIYSNEPGGEPRQQKRISLIFDNDHIIGIQGDFRPSTLPVAKVSDETIVDLPKRDIEQTLWEKLTGIAGQDDIDDASDSERKPSPLPTTSDQPL